MEGNAMPGCYQYPPGFRFHPSDQELITHYLSNKVAGTLPLASSIIVDVDLYKFDPWKLPAKAMFGEGEWFFFSPRDRKYPNGARPNRSAGCGYWKATGTDKPILTTGGTQCIGVKKALVFYKGRPPKGTKTDWVMHEYRLLDGVTSGSHKHKGTMKLDDWVLCRVREKSSYALRGGKEKPETSSISRPMAATENPSIGAIDESFKWSEYQLLAHLMSEESQNGSSGSGADPMPGECALTQPDVVSSVLRSIKRALSFGPLDEMMLFPSRKRPNCSEQQLSPSCSSVDQALNLDE